MKDIIILAAALSVILYYIIAEVTYQLKNRLLRRRVIIGVLIAALLLSQTSIVNVFTRTGAETASAAERAKIITAFAELPEDIREQTVPVGTALEELVLPDTLEAVCVAAEADAGDDTDTTDSQVGGGTSENEDDAENITPGEESDKEDKAPEDDSQAEDNNLIGEEQPSEENDAEESEEGHEEEAVGTDAETFTESAKEAAMQTETGSFTMPEYRSENVVEVKTLEADLLAEKADDGSEENHDEHTDEASDSYENSETSAETITIENITWQSAPEYDGDTEGEYVFTAVLPQGYKLTNRVNAPQIIVTVGEESEESEIDEAVLAVQEMIDALPSVKEVKAMDKDGQRAAYDQTQKAYDAYMALSEKQRGLITGAEIFEELFAYFNGMTAPLFSGGDGSESTPYQIKTAADLKQLASDVSGGNDYSGKYFKVMQNIDLSSVCGANVNGVEVSWTPIGTYAASNDFKPFSGIFDGGGYEVSGLYINYTSKDGNADSAEALFGYVGSTGNIKNLSVSGTVTNLRGSYGSYGAGIVGYNKGGTIENCHNNSSVKTYSWNLGGIVGYNNGGIIKDCYNTGSVYSTGSGMVGGIAGVNAGTGTITNCYNVGSVDGNGNGTGGIVGVSYNSVTNCYNTGNVNNHNYAMCGGIVGRNLTGSAIANCYNIGSVTGPSVVGEIVGQFSAGTVDNCYYLTGKTGGGIGVSGSTTGEDVAGQAEVKDKAGFASQDTFSGWDFNDTWIMSDWNGRPVLRNLSYTVTFDLNYDDSSPIMYYVEYDTQYGTMPKPERPGYKIDGWFTAKDGGSRVTSGTITSNVTLYAQWKEVYTVTFDPKGGDVSETTREYEAGEKYANGKYGDLPVPTRDGYTFAGWYEDEAYTETKKVTKDSAVSGTITLYAKWTPKEYNIIYLDQGGAAFSGTHENGHPTVHTYGTVTPLKQASKKGYTFGGWYADSECKDDKKVTELAADGYLGDITLYAEWVDDIKPVIGELTYNYTPKTVNGWAVGKDKLVITVPVTEEGSGASEITYTVTLDNGTSSTESAELTAAEETGIMKAAITVNADFKGSIEITCTDNADNTSDSVTAGENLSGADDFEGIIIEGNAPTVSFEIGGSAVSGEAGYYDEAPDVKVTVTDNTDNVISGGIASVTYQVDNGAAKAVNGDFTTGIVPQYSFTIPAGEIPTGVNDITVKVEDNAGNIGEEILTVKVKGPERMPEATVDRSSGKITDLAPGAVYDITYTGEDGKQHTDTVTADENGNLEIKDDWTGGDIEIVKKGNGSETTDSMPQSVDIPKREPAPPDVKTSKKAGKDGQGGSIGGLTPGETYQISKDGGETWEDVTADEDGEIKPVDAGSYDIRKKAGDNTLPSKSVHVEVTEQKGGSSGGSGSGKGGSGSGGNDSDNGDSTGGDDGSSSSDSGSPSNSNGGQTSGGGNGGSGTGTGIGTPGGTGNTGNTGGKGVTGNTSSTGNTDRDKAYRTAGSGDGKKPGSTGSSTDGDSVRLSSDSTDAQTSDGSGQTVQAEPENGEIVVSGDASGTDGTGSGADADVSSGFPASLSWTAVALWSLGILAMIGIVIFLIFRKRRKEEEAS